jgi:hypothetical protein
VATRGPLGDSRNDTPIVRKHAPNKNENGSNEWRFIDSSPARSWGTATQYTRTSPTPASRFRTIGSRPGTVRVVVTPTPP